MEECGKPIEVGQRSGRPFDVHRSCRGVNDGVPHVPSHRATSSCGTVASPAVTALALGVAVIESTSMVSVVIPGL